MPATLSAAHTSACGMRPSPRWIHRIEQAIQAVRERRTHVPRAIGFRELTSIFRAAGFRPDEVGAGWL